MWPGAPSLHASSPLRTPVASLGPRPLSLQRSRDAHLLDPAEWGLTDAMAALPPAPLALALRLLLRKRAWHAVAGLPAYPDVPDPPAAVDALASRTLARLDASLARASELGELLGGLPAETLRAALLQLLPARHPAAAAAGGGKGGKQALVSAVQVRTGVACSCLERPTAFFG